MLKQHYAILQLVYREHDQLHGLTSNHIMHQTYLAKLDNTKPDSSDQTSPCGFSGVQLLDFL